MKRLLLLTNPSASRFTGALYRDVMRILGERFEVDHEWPEDAGATRREATRAASAGYDLVAAMGGDGVVHHAANGLVGSTTALALIPAGTTNVLARILGVPLRARKAAAALADWQPHPVPLARVDYAGAGGTANCFATFAVGIGYDADVVQRADATPHRKLTLGSVHFARSAVGILWSHYRSRLPTLRVESNGRRADALAVSVQVHGPYTYFGPVPLRIGSFGDGLNVAVSDRLGAVATATVISRMATRRPLDGKGGIEVWEGVTKLTIEADPPASLQADGELLGVESEVSVVVAGEPLWVAAPEER